MASSLPCSVPQASTEARKLVRSAIVTTLGKQEFLATTTRAAAVQVLGKYMLKLPENNLTFNNFCDYLVGTLKMNFQTVGRCRSSATKREHLWRAFHRQSIEELPPKWNGLYTSLSLTDKVDNLFHQTVNLVVYEQLLKEHFAVERAPQSTVEVQLSKDELNALRYASGYVPMKLLKKYKKKGEMERKRMGKKIDQFEMCLGNMAVASEETEFTQCSSEWFHKVNRGGLFPINDETLTFFIAVEKVTRQHLPHQHASQGQENMKKSVMKAISEDIDVQFYWTLISQDIDDEEDAIELLTDVCDMWITIRGFSMASAWLEEYKKQKKTKVAKKRGLRKDLYRKMNPPMQTGQKHAQPEAQDEEDEVEEEQEGVEEEKEMEYKT